MYEKVINLGIIEIKFLDESFRGNELYSIHVSDWRLPTAYEIEYISNLYTDYKVVGRKGWYWVNTGGLYLYEIGTQYHFRPFNLDSEGGGVILVRDI
jgi:hypothetical protein